MVGTTTRVARSRSSELFRFGLAAPHRASMPADAGHRRYGFKNVVLPSDILTAHPEIYPFSKVFADYHTQSSLPLPAPVVPSDPSTSLKIDAIFVYNDPRDWGLDISLIVDCLLSSRGIMGTLSAKNGNTSLSNNGYQQDGQPPLYFSNPDLWFAAEYALNRFGQGGFRAALEGVWSAVTGGKENGVELSRTVIGKPSQEMYLYAEKQLQAHRTTLYGMAATDETPLQQVYMVGDNPGKSLPSSHFDQSLNLCRVGHPGCQQLQKPAEEPLVLSPSPEWRVRGGRASTHAHCHRRRCIRCGQVGC